MSNPLLSVDSYKLSHFNQYPIGTEHIYSYGVPRKGLGKIVITGINEFVQQINCGLTENNVEELKELASRHGVPWNTQGWEALVSKYGEDAQFPILVRGVPEGSLVDSGTPVFTVVNTDPEFPWLTSFFETLALRCVWYPSTVATISRNAKRIIKAGMEKTGADMTGLPFKLHDFGARGVSSGESAMFGGAGHLINFMGTDTIEALEYVMVNYNADMPGFSIAATEHSTVTSWGREGEFDMYRTFIQNNLGEGKIAACVIDSYDDDEAVKMFYTLDEYIKAAGGTLVLRPDSGCPIETPIKIIKAMMDLWGYDVTSEGYKVLPARVRVLQGDGITLTSLQAIVDRLIEENISLDNIAFGMGGGLLQHCDRDTYGWAMKASAACVAGQWRDVYKDPKAGGKTSLRGLVYSHGTMSEEQAFNVTTAGLSTMNWVTYYHGERCYVRPADSWEDIKQRAEVLS